MKTLKEKLVLVVVLMLGTFINYANNKEVNSNLNTKKVKVVFEKAKKGHQLTIKDDHGLVLYSEDVQKEGELRKVFDFSKLKNGSYTLELEKDFQIVIKSIKIDDDKISFDENSKKVIYKPVVRNEKNKLLISKITLDKKPLKVSLYYNNNIIYSETLKEDSVIKNRIYKLDENIKGDYKVVIRNNGRSYTNEFEI